MPDQNYHYPDATGAMRPRPSAWLRHSALLLATLASTTVSGVFGIFGKYRLEPPIPESFSETLIYLPLAGFYLAKLVYVLSVAVFSDWELVKHGLSFSLPFLFILACHEAGHYIACRIYRVDATLPYFIPMPPPLFIGTLGAFIKIISPMPSRRAVFDIGVAGPLAGFIALLPIAVYGVATARQLSPEELALAQPDIILSDPLLLKLIAWFYGIDLSISTGSTFYGAAWLGLFVTSLNLVPSGQLDGGHAVYAVFGEKIHFWSGRAAFALMLACAIAGILFFDSISGILFLAILAAMMFIRHPRPYDLTPLDFKRKIAAFATMIVFILSFTPFPFQIPGLF